jgi:arylformamidase
MSISSLSGLPAARCRGALLVLGVALSLTLVVALTALAGPAPSTAATSPATCRGNGSRASRDVPYKTVAGVDPGLLSLDLYTPILPAGCGPAPIVVYVHGGGFRNGDKANKIDDKVDLFTGEGWVFASVNYRLSPDPPNDLPGQVRYPTHEEDVVSAIDWLRDHSGQLGGDPNRMFLVGHSSGAFIASLISTDTSLLAAAGLGTGNVRCTVALDTEYDVADQVAQGGTQEVLYRNGFGNDPATWAQGSPINHTQAGTSRPRFLVYTRGAARRIERSRDFASALTAGGTVASVIDASPLDHEAVSSAVGAPGDARVTPPLMTFLRSCATAATEASDASWTAAAYEDFLGRAPTAAAVDATTFRLAAGTPRSTVAEELTSSDEWLSHIVTDLYHDTLDRDPDAGGLTFWTGQMRTGHRTVAQVATQFYASPEYYSTIGGGTDISWVTDLYDTLLHRDPELDGLTYWTERTATSGRGDVAGAIYGSIESRKDRVEALFEDLLGRPAEPSGLAYWADRLDTDGDLTLAVHLVASAEYGRRAEARFP